MVYRVFRLREKGWILPRHRTAFRAVSGTLQVVEVQSPTLNRSERVATLFDPSTGIPLADIAPLHDAQLIHFAAGRMTLSGIEYLPDEVNVRTFGFAQSWLLIPSDDPDLQPADKG